MAEIMHAQINSKLKEVIKQARFFSITCDEVTSIDNKSWLCIHIYTEERWGQVPMLLSLERVVDTTAKNMMTVLVQAMMVKGGLTRQEIAEKLIMLGADGASVFQGTRTGVC